MGATYQKLFSNGASDQKRLFIDDSGTKKRFFRVDKGLFGLVFYSYNILQVVVQHVVDEACNAFRNDYVTVTDTLFDTLPIRWPDSIRYQMQSN